MLSQKKLYLEFLDSCKSSEFAELKKKVRNQGNLYWWFFGFGSSWGSQCNKCSSHLKKIEKLSFDIEDLDTTTMVCKEMINCWKIELWESSLVDLEKVLIYLLKLCLSDSEIHGKYSIFLGVWEEEKGERLGMCNSHSIPDSAKPKDFLEGKIKKDHVILIYAQSIKEREEVRKKVFDDLRKLELYKGEELPPYRRGCIQPHEEVFGPWEKWYDINKDFEGKKK